MVQRVPSTYKQTLKWVVILPRGQNKNFGGVSRICGVKDCAATERLEMCVEKAQTSTSTNISSLFVAAKSLLLPPLSTHPETHFDILKNFHPCWTLFIG